MKASDYNYIFYKDDTSFWYNGLTRRFFRTSSELGKKIEKVLSSGKLYDLPESIISRLTAHGFIVPKETTELDIIRNTYKKVIESKNYFLVILPTLNCNFDCWYCIQHHIPSNMSDAVKQSVIKHIEHMMRNGLDSFHIEWFGGEPFMGFKNVILPISKFAKAVCEEKGIPFRNTATTNGFFITEDKYESLAAIDMTGFQITLDGDREHHNNVKKAKGNNSAFDTTLKNISGYLEYNKDATLKLRINYTHENLTGEIIDQVETYFSDDSRKRVQINLKKVWQEKVDKNFYPEALKFQKNFSKCGFKVNTLDITTGFVPCYANRKYYTAINYNGDLLKCTASDDLYKEEALGTLQEDGTLSWKNGVEDSYQDPPFENKRCLQCKYLPICMGQCPRNHINGSSACKIDSFDIKLDMGIINYINEQYDSLHK